MTKKKTIPCRVCGKLFEPCAYCQSHSDIFRWRNFACSRECATKYINDTITYRESLKRQEENKKEPETKVASIEIVTQKTAKRKHKKTSMESIEDNNKLEITNNETE